MTLNPFRQRSPSSPFGRSGSSWPMADCVTIERPEFAAMDPRGREVTFYEEDGTQHFIEAMLIEDVVVRPSPEPSQAR